ncbi:DeoR/GlpR family DNA-binding transcription regulator [Psychromicrobium xiongbiense]|uniref:DeoR/GlpR family DNA-binding transcription regulator n=1 Tax=Psychromicrobium xiongbiense TaxID=3051184 RepID=UPI0025533987|nr:DeoR/GlpR family DNA-binding transcription regulator [Psychromicrobium sp. YIM S02556]
MNSEERARRVTDLLRHHERVEVEQLVADFDASPATIRRDLDVLEKRGVLRRVHGGAVSLLLGGAVPGYEQRALESSQAKALMARAAAALIHDKEFVFLDSGSTATAVASVLASRDLSVAAANLHAVRELTGARAEVLLLGGSVIVGELALRGPLTEQNIASLRFDTAIITPCAFTFAEGPLAHDLADAAIKRAAMTSAHRTMVVCEASKFARSAPVLLGGLRQVDLLVTDYTLSAEEHSLALSAGIEVHTV